MNNEKIKINNEEGREQATAQKFINAIKTIATKPSNLDNLENYLSRHFQKWLERYANDPENITAELENFANMEI